MELTINLDQITAEMDELKDHKARLSFELREVEKEIEKRELQLIALLGQMDVKTMDFGIYSFGFKEYSRTAFDQQAFKKAHPAMFEKYYIPKVTERFEFKINK